MLTDQETHEAAELEQVHIWASRGDRRSIEALEQRAAAGSSTAKLFLGEIYQTRGPLFDTAKAERWYREAYEQNPSPWATLLMGRFLYLVRRNDESIAVLSKCAAEENYLCMFWLALAYREQKGDRRAEIRKLLEKSSQQGHLKSTRLLSILLMKGDYGLSEVPGGLCKFLGFMAQLARVAFEDPKDPRLFW